MDSEVFDLAASPQLDALDYPWTAEPARHFSGVLDVRAPAAIPCWTSRRSILKAIHAALVSPEGIRKRQEQGARKDGTGGGIAVEAVMSVAEEDCRTADSSTGRNVMTSHETVMRRLRGRGMKISLGTVRKARRVLQRLGFQTTIEEGRYLTKTERLAYALAHPQKPGKTGRQYIPWRRAATRVFTMSAEVVRATGPLPRRGSKTPNLKKVKTNQRRCRASSNSQISKKSGVKPGMANSPRPLGIQKIAAKLIARYGWLSAVSHTNSVSDILIASGVEESVWTGTSLINALNGRSEQRGWRTPDRVANPIGYLRHLLQDLDPAATAKMIYRPSRAQTAAKETQKAQAALDRLRSPEHRANVAKGVALLRAALQSK